MAERATQSTAGNNILSQVEYDAVLSHMEVVGRAAVQPNAFALCYQDMRDLIGTDAGTPMRRDHIERWLAQVRGITLASTVEASITLEREIAHAERAKRAIAYLLERKRGS